MTAAAGPPHDGLVFKIATREQWQEACRHGHLSGSVDDVRDGFIHLSAAHQLMGTAAKHFRNQRGLVLLVIDARQLGSALRWEPSRGGDLFPHLYAPLPMRSVLHSTLLQLDADGVPVLPQEIVAP